MASSSKYFVGVHTTKVGTLSPGHIKTQKVGTPPGPESCMCQNMCDLCASDHITTEISKSMTHISLKCTYSTLNLATTESKKKKGSFWQINIANDMVKT